LTQDLLKVIVKKVCIDFKIAGGAKSVCDSMIDNMADILLPVIGNGLLSSDRICDETLHFCASPKIKEINPVDFVNARIAAKPSVIRSNDYVNKIYEKINADTNPRPIRRSLHLADLHLDFEYSVDSPTKCDLPICCRNWGDKSKNNSGKALYWGDYNCDLPTHTLDAMFDFIVENQSELKTDFVTWTGDNSAHNTWNNTKEEITKYT
jgi:hypothetical protein